MKNLKILLSLAFILVVANCFGQSVFYSPNGHDTMSVSWGSRVDQTLINGPGYVGGISAWTSTSGALSASGTASFYAGTPYGGWTYSEWVYVPAVSSLTATYVGTDVPNTTNSKTVNFSSLYINWVVNRSFGFGYGVDDDAMQLPGYGVSTSSSGSTTQTINIVLYPIASSLTYDFLTGQYYLNYAANAGTSGIPIFYANGYLPDTSYGSTNNISCSFVLSGATMSGW